MVRAGLGQLPEAAQQFELVKRLAVNGNDAEGVALAEQRLQALRSSLGCVSVFSPDDGVTVLVDGKRRGTTPLAATLYLQPGRHRLTGERRSAPPDIVDFEIAAGESRRIALASRPAPATRPAPPAVVSTPPPPDERLVRQREQEAKERRQKTRWGYATLGAAGALVATSAVLFVAGGLAGERAKKSY